MAALAACNTIQGRLVDFAAEHWGVPESQVEFLPGFVRVGNQKVVFADFIEAAYMARVSLSSTGFYKTPKIHWDRKAGKGRPFYYYSYGAAASEVVVDRSEEHTSELQSLMRISYAVFCLKKKNNNTTTN